MRPMLGAGMQGHSVRHRVVETGDEKRVLRQFDPLLQEARPRVGIVEKRSQDPRGDLSGLAGTGAALIGACMRIIGDMGAMAEQQHQAGMPLCQTHCPQHGRGNFGLLRGGQAAHDPGSGFGPRPRGAETERILHELPAIERPRGLHKGE
ncbi:hypothetical protein D3C87_1503460 [compost metagenome]